MLTIISYFGLLLATLLFTIVLFVGLTKIQLI
uniref:Cytochrome b6-f complex subunit 6 n=1 Tax=Closterium baillyanum TaxID=1416941 RepID=A0A191T5S5_9VIRI|nr:subunit VI of cytochrome b6/f complex [Closterium baillyanum]ANI25756.1 subunit VI of cytochrome b6/f complex [Closterium baillyanum]